MLIRGDARRIPIVGEAVQCVVTSPPYWGLRDYGIDSQIGLEATPEKYTENIVDVFRELWRVLKPDGTVWLNLGDVYCGGGRGWEFCNPEGKQLTNRGCIGITRSEMPLGLKSKDLLGLPWMIAFALRADGWYLRSDIIWEKKNPMPESVKDRPTKSHEYIFLLTKNQKYYYDADAIREPAQDWGTRKREGQTAFTDGVMPDGSPHRGCKDANFELRGRNKRSVWTVATQHYKGSHFAVFPERLITPCILAGSKVGDIVFDPFVGSGTTVRCAERHNRKGLGLDLSYQDISKVRTTDVQKMLLEL